MVTVVLVLILPFGLISCLNSDDPENPDDTLKRDIETIDNYLAANNIDAIEDPTGVRMDISILGTGFPAQKNSKIDVDYIGKLFSDGSTFDDGNIVTDLGNLIGGWQIAFTTLPAGSKATIYVPSGWAYGTRENQGIPPNSILVFDVAFNEVVETTAQQQRLGADSVAIDDYLSTKGIVAEKDTTGLRYVVTQLGTGSKPGWYDRVKFKAVYKLLTDDTKVVHTQEFAPGEGYYSRVIDQIPNGIKQGLQELPAGSKATFYLPSGLAFGTSGAAISGQLVIPANANLIIDVDFSEIVTP